MSLHEPQRMPQHDHPRVSIVIPVYNDTQGIHNCLDALTAQQWPAEALEVVVVDNASGPPVQLRAGYPFQIQLALCEKPGSYAARNVGAAVARHEILAFTDADCVPDSRWLRAGVATLVEARGNAIIGGEVIISSPEPRTATGLYQHIAGFQQADNIQRSGFTATANLFCYRTQFLDIGQFDERLLSGGDRDWSWRARRKGFNLVFAADAVVKTPARTSLRAAVRQARRVAAGRMLLRNLELAPSEANATDPHRGPSQALRLIMSHPALSAVERVQVLGIAVLIRLATILERWRLKIGTAPERR